MKALRTLFLFCVLLPLYSLPENSRTLSFQLAYYPDHHEGAQGKGFQPPWYNPIELPQGFIPLGGDQGRDLGNGWGNIKFKAIYQQDFVYSFLQGEHFLTEDNQLKVQIQTNLSPVTLGMDIKAILTPVAFFKLEAGTHMGTGWNLGFNGLGVHSDGNGNPEEDSLAGVVLKGWVQGSFQVDLEAFWPGEWNHIVFLTDHKFLYQRFSGAWNEQPWQYEADRGENFNGWRYESSYLLGYQMPLRVNFVGFRLEPSRYIGEVARMSPIDDGGWGSDFFYLRFGPLLNIQLTERGSLLILLQGNTGPVYTEDSIHYNFFMNRKATGGSYWYWERLALVYSFKI